MFLRCAAPRRAGDPAREEIHMQRKNGYVQENMYIEIKYRVEYRDTI